jgi:hypothetical protein
MLSAPVTATRQAHPVNPAHPHLAISHHPFVIYAPNVSIASSVLDRALASAERRGECLLATEWRPQPKGYVRVRAGSRGYVMLHRLSLEERLGRALTPEETVDHQCHNRDLTCLGGNQCWHRRCFNPDHLAVESAVDNWRNGRQGVVSQRRALTHCPYGHPYEQANLRASKAGARACKACHRAGAAGRSRANEPTYL